MKRENIKIGIKVVPHSKSYCGNLESSVNWKHAKKVNQPYLFVTNIRSDYIVLNSIEESNNGDFFLPEDFEPYIKEINNESRNLKMKKSELNSSMLFKMRDGDLCVLLEDIEGSKVFCNKYDIEQGYSDNHVTIDDFDEDLSSEGDDYDIVAIKQRNSCVRAIYDVLEERSIKEWDWVEDAKKEESIVEEPQTPVIHNITINLTLDSNNDDPVNFMRQLNDAFEKLNKDSVKY